MSAKAPKIVILGDVKDAERALNQLNRKMANAQRSLKGRLQKMGRNFRDMGARAARGLAMAAAAAAAASVALAAQFDDSMQRMVSLVGLSQETVDGLKGSILDLSGRTAKAPKELADAMFYITSAGLRGSDAMEALTMSAQASAAGLGDVETIADAVTSAMNAYGSENVSASQATDVLVAAVREGKLEAADLAGSLGKVIPVASQMGVTFDQVGAAIATMSRIGIDADTGTTALRAMLTGLLKPSSDAEAALRELGTSSAELRSRIADEGLLPVLMDLSNRFDGNAAAMARIFPNVRALTGVLATVGKNAEEAAGIFARMADTTGMTAQAFSDAETPALRMRKAFARLKAEGVDIGEEMVPAVADLVESLVTLADVAQPSLVASAAQLSEIIDGLTYISLAAAGAHSEQAKATMRLVEASASLRSAAEKGEDPTDAFANAIAHLARNGAVTADALERLGRESGLTSEQIVAATAAAADYDYVTEKQSRTLKNATKVGLRYILSLGKDRNAVGDVVKGRITLIGATTDLAYAQYKSGAATVDQIRATYGAAAADELASRVKREAFQAAMAASKAYVESGGAAERSAGSIFANTRVTSQSELAALGAKAAQDKLRDAFERTGGAAGVTAGAILALSRRIRGQTDPVFAAIDAAQAYRDKLAEVRKDGKITAAEQVEVAQTYADFRAAVLTLGAGDMKAGLEQVAALISDSLGIPIEEARESLRGYAQELGALDGRTIAVGIEYDTQMAAGHLPEGMSGGTTARGRGPALPRFADGGTFRAPKPGGAGLAILHDRETVTPADRPAGPTIIQLVVDSRVLAEVVRDADVRAG